jgi:two-component system response regulator
MDQIPLQVILLVEDNAADEQLALRAFQKHRLANEVVVARDGVEALDYLFGTGAYAGRDVSDLPQVMLLDLILPKLDGREVLRRVRADERTRFLPVVMMTSSDDQRHLIESYLLGVDSFVRKPVDFNQFVRAVQQLGMDWLILNGAPKRQTAVTKGSTFSGR